MWKFLCGVCISLLVLINLSSGIKVSDSTPDFVKFWEGSKDLSLEERAKRFQEEITPNLPDGILEILKGSIEVDYIKKSLQAHEAYHDKFMDFYVTFHEDFYDALNVFLKFFPDFKKDFRVYIIHSLGEMDGGTRFINGGLSLVLGLDCIAKYHDKAGIHPFIHHELFHIYHQQFFKENNVFWRRLWAEGLATYVAEKLNPSATHKDIMLDFPKGLINACKADMKILWQEVQRLLLSTNSADYKRYFLMSSQDKKTPKRAGYYLGYLIAHNLALKFSMSELIQMDEKEIFSSIQKAISSFINEL